MCPTEEPYSTHPTASSISVVHLSVFNVDSWTGEPLKRVIIINNKQCREIKTSEFSWLLRPFATNFTVVPRIEFWATHSEVIIELGQGHELWLNTPHVAGMSGRPFIELSAKTGASIKGPCLHLLGKIWCICFAFYGPSLLLFPLGQPSALRSLLSLRLPFHNQICTHTELY